jgi:MFS family permease
VFQQTDGADNIERSGILFMTTRRHIVHMLPWLIWAVGATSFGFAFFQRVAPSVMVDSLMRDLAVGAAVLGNLSAIYFYAYAGLQVPIGVLLDRFGPRRMLSVAALVAGIGAGLFASADTTTAAYFGRLMVGIGSAVGLIGTMKLVSHWFPANRFATVTGLIMPIAMLGGVLGQAPLALLVDDVGWRPAMYGAAIFGLLLGTISWLVIRDHPGGAAPTVSSTKEKTPLRRDLAEVVRSRQNWLLAIFGGAMSGPMLAYAALWGVPHLMLSYEIERASAAGVTSIMLIGGAVGAPFAGRLTDMLGRRKPPMVIFASLTTISWLAIIYIPGIPLFAVGIMLFIAGIGSGSMVIAFAVVSDTVPARMTATTTGFVNTATVGAGALLQPLVGVVLDASWDGTVDAGVRIYDISSYQLAFLSLPACGLLALMTAALVKESMGTNTDDGEEN